MSFAFIDPTSKVAVQEGEDTVYIVGKLSKRQRGLVQQELLSLQIKQQSAEAAGAGNREDDDQPVTVDAKISAHLHELALLKAAVTDWDGPSFQFPNGKKVPCSSSWIERIDPDAPIWQAVLKKIDELNTPRKTTPPAIPMEPEPRPGEGVDDPNGRLPADSTYLALETVGTEG
jgi:hypothetical protein